MPMPIPVRPRVARPRVTEIRCKTALNRVRGMGFHWSLNPYRGCEHHCAYCYARTTHAFLGLDVGEDFASQLFAKTNVAEVLRAELGRKSWQRELVAIGTSTDPYQPLEGRYRLTRACLTVLASTATPATVTTKGTLVVRDVDVLLALHQRAGAGVNVSLITLDQDIWRALEPGTPPPEQRLRALRRLVDAGVPAGVALAPVLPGLTDAPSSLEAVVRAAVDNGASWLWAGSIHMEPAIRDYFLECLDKHFPQAIGPYQRVFGARGGPARARYSPRGHADAVQRRIAELKTRYGLEERRLPAARSVPAKSTDDPRPDRTVGASWPRQMALPL